MKKYRYETILFFVDAIAMILELVASRVLSPYFGNSNFVWTSVIGIILLSSSIGNYYGGKMADGKDIENNLKMIICATTLSILAIPIVQNYILQDISTTIYDIKIGAILSTIALFFIPSLLMGFLTPIIVKLKLSSLETAGAISGKINAIATLGGITGTFLGGFFLIPNFGSIEILFLLSIVLTLLVFLIDFKLSIRNILFASVTIILSITLMIAFTNNNLNKGDAVLNGDMDAQVRYDTQYGHVLVYNEMENGEPIRVLNIDSGYNSATFIEKEKRNELVFEYTKLYNLMFDSKKAIKNTLMIGGAGYSYPKYYISHYADKYMDVVEIDGEITEIAKQYFYLDDLIQEYDLEDNQRLRFITEDGRTYLNNNQKKYDAILNDAFSGISPAKTLTTLEAIENIKKSLVEDGLYLTNIISSLEGENSRFLKAEINTLKQVFDNVYIIPCDPVEDLNITINVMVVATDSALEFENEYKLMLDENEIIITDNYCPVDSLVPKF